MRSNYWLVMAAVVLCSAAILAPGNSSFSEDGFYVIAGGSPWKRNGADIYYLNGKVGIGTNIPGYPLDVRVPGSAIIATSTDTSGIHKGVYGITSSSDQNAVGVYGTGPGSAKGVVGESYSGLGVYGVTTGPYGHGVKGESLFTSAGGCGVIGITKSPNAAAYGVFGQNTSTVAEGVGCGVKGDTTYGYGVRGEANSGFGVCGLTGAGYGVWGEANSGFGVYSKGHFYCTGNSTVLGTKSAVVATSQGERRLYSQESPEVWFEDFGEGQLKGGKARIKLDPLFLETVTINDQHPLKVFIQLNDDCNGVFVQRGNTGFEVKELRGGTSHAHFTYRVVAKRKGFETARLEAAPDPVKVAGLKRPPAAKAPPALAALQH